MATKVRVSLLHLINVAALSIMLSACAINDSGSKPTAPSITLNAPPAIVIEGACAVTPELEDWLQVTVSTRKDFQVRLDEAAAKNASDVYEDTLYLAALRDTVARTRTPDCGVEVHGLLINSMTSVVSVLQAYNNRALSGNLNDALIEPQKSLVQVDAIQNQLITRMKNQYQLENNLTPTPSS